MERTAVFPGTFDPITKGHEDIIRRALPLFDNIIVAVGTNSAKQHMFSVEQRMQWIKDIFKSEAKISVETYEGLTVDYCKSRNARFILRGLRTQTDFEYEKAISQMNQALANEIETVFLITNPSYSAISSSIVREVLRYKGDVSKFLPDAIRIS